MITCGRRTRVLSAINGGTLYRTDVQIVSSLLSGVAAVDGQRDSDDKAGARAAQPEDGCCDLLALAETANRCRRSSLGPVEFALGDHVGDHWSLDGAGADGVDADPAGRVLQCGAGGQSNHPVLGSVVGSPARESDETAEGGAVDDGAAALGAHLAQLMFHAGPYTTQVDRVDTVEDLSRFVRGIAGWNLDAGVVERHIEPAERADGRLHHGRHAVLVRHVTTNPQDLVTSGCQLLGGRIKRGLVDVR